MPDGGKLTIETGNAHLDDAYARRSRDVTPGQYVCICVTDTGTGMPPDVIAQAFDPFFTTKPIGQGTGLGLSMVYGFARQSEGHANLQRGGAGHDGQDLPAALPRRGDAETTVATLAEAHRAERGETVLVVEDEPVVREPDRRGAAGSRLPGARGGGRPRGAEDPAVATADRPSGHRCRPAGAQRAPARRRRPRRRPDLKILFITGYAENATIAPAFWSPAWR